MACTTHTHLRLGFNCSQELRLKECTVAADFIGHISVSHCCLANNLADRLNDFLCSDAHCF